MDWDPFSPDEVRVDMYRTPTLDGSGAECVAVWRVQDAALRRLGIKPPPG
jgi:hypothetical protein